jgi:hypothetical protein
MMHGLSCVCKLISFLSDILHQHFSPHRCYKHSPPAMMKGIRVNRSFHKLDAVFCCWNR